MGLMAEFAQATEFTLEASLQSPKIPLPLPPTSSSSVPSLDKARLPPPIAGRVYPSVAAASGPAGLDMVKRKRGRPRDAVHCELRTQKALN